MPSAIDIPPKHRATPVGQIKPNKGSLSGIDGVRFQGIGLHGFWALRQLLPAIQSSDDDDYYIMQNNVSFCILLVNNKITWALVFFSEF